jgi:hypothetical protein
VKAHEGATIREQERWAFDGLPNQEVAARWSLQKRLLSGAIRASGIDGEGRPALSWDEMSPIGIVAGGRGVGKTALVRRFLESNKSRVVCASRCQAVPGSGDWTEETLPANPARDTRVPHCDELRQYEAAGADLVSVVSYDTDLADPESVLRAAAGDGGWDEWIVEVDSFDHARSGCAVFVGRPLCPLEPP